MQAPAASIVKTADGIAARGEATARAKATANPAVNAGASQALQETFAEILARRLEKSTVFDIRLDPPALGRVEGRLTVGDDGKSVLTLAFDNQSAFDLFSRDEAALRLALANAGLSFGDRDVSFSFREQGAGERSPSMAARESAAAYDPEFYADWSAGALDIRI